MTKTYLQFIFTGNCIFNNTILVTQRDSWEAMKYAVKCEENDRNLTIIGFRFFDSNEDLEVSNVSITHYIRGEVYTYPKASSEILQYISKAGIKLDKGNKFLIYCKFYPMIYLFKEDDVLEDYDKVIKKIEEEKNILRIKELHKEYNTYRDNVINALSITINKLKEGYNNKIGLIESTIELNGIQKKIKPISLLNDNGDFGYHIEKLNDIQTKIIELQQNLSGVESLDE